MTHEFIFVPSFEDFFENLADVRKMSFWHTWLFFKFTRFVKQTSMSCHYDTGICTCHPERVPNFQVFLRVWQICQKCQFDILEFFLFSKFVKQTSISCHFHTRIYTCVYTRHLLLILKFSWANVKKLLFRILSHKCVIFFFFFGHLRRKDERSGIRHLTLSVHFTFADHGHEEAQSGTGRSGPDKGPEEAQSAKEEKEERPKRAPKVSIYAFSTGVGEALAIFRNVVWFSCKLWKSDF